MATTTESGNSSDSPGATILAEIYDTERFGQLYYGSRNPPVQNLGLAARYIISLFRHHGIPFAFLGGWAIYLRGGHRSTQDVDITVAGYMDDLKAIMLQEQRLCVPQTHGDTAIQVFAHTGGHWDPTTPNTRVFTISMDLIIGGYLGTPPDLPNGTEELRPVPNTTQGRQAVPVIDLYYQVATKLGAHYTRRQNGGINDYTDLDFLVRQYPQEIYFIRDYLDLDHKWAFYADFAANNDPDSTTFLAQTLGLELAQDTGATQV